MLIKFFKKIIRSNWNELSNDKSVFSFYVGGIKCPEIEEPCLVFPTLHECIIMFKLHYMPIRYFLVLFPILQIRNQMLKVVDLSRPHSY
jgi:hypothetical protein